MHKDPLSGAAGSQPVPRPARGRHAQGSQGRDRRTGKDPGTVTTLADDSGHVGPDIPSCPTAGRDVVRKTSAGIGRARSWYARQAGTLKTDAKAVLASRDARILADAQGVYDSSAGRVTDENTRTTLKAMLDRKDAQAVKGAVDAVNASVQAKTEADRIAAEAPPKPKPKHRPRQAAQQAAQQA